MTEAEIAWLRSEFDRCREWLQAALDRDPIKTHTIDDVWSAIEAGRAQLWPCHNSAMVTEIEEYPQLKALRGWLAGGRLEEIILSEPIIRAWAEKNGCDFIMILGRRGWSRVFPGYTEAHSVMVRRL